MSEITQLKFNHLHDYLKVSSLQCSNRLNQLHNDFHFNLHGCAYHLTALKVNFAKDGISHIWGGGGGGGVGGGGNSVGRACDSW